MKKEKFSTKNPPIELFQALFDGIPDAVYFKDTRGRLVMVNKAHAAGLGLSPQDVIGKTDFDFFPFTQAQRMTEDDKKVIKTGSSLVDVVERTTRPDGSRHCVSTTKLARKDESGRVVGIMGITRDITERTQLEENRYHMLFETSQNCIFITTKDGDWVDINEAGVKLFGYNSKRELFKTKVGDIYADPREREIYIRKIEREGFVKDYELDLKKKNGAVMHALITAIARKDNKNKIVGYQGSILDITDRKEAEAQKEDVLQTLNSRVKELSCLYRIEEIRQKEHSFISQTFDEIANVVPLSWQYPRITGCSITYRNERYCTRNFRRSPWVQKADIVANDKTVGVIEVCYLEKKANDFEGPFSSEERKLLDAIAQRLGLFIERKLMDEALEELIKELADIKFALNTSSILAMTDKKGKITYANDRFCEISKYSREELIGQDHRIVNSGYHPKEFMRNLWHTIIQGQVWRGEIRNRAKDGSIYWVDTTIVPFLDKNRKPYQYVAIRTEITKRKQMEEALKELPQKIIQTQESERNRISREIHDDLGQSLAILKMIIQSTMNVKNSPKAHPMESYEKIITHLDIVIEKSRHLASGLRPAALEILGLSNALEGLVSDFQQKRDLRIRFRHPSLDRFIFQGEVINLYRVIQEALNNVVTHAHAKEVSILMQKKHDQLWVTIKDNGRGFKHGEKKESTEAHRGIGLSTMEERIKLLGGDFKILSGPNKGTALIFHIPVSTKRSA